MQRRTKNEGDHGKRCSQPQHSILTLNIQKMRHGPIRAPPITFALKNNRVASSLKAAEQRIPVCGNETDVMQFRVVVALVHPKTQSSAWRAQQCFGAIPLLRATENVKNDTSVVLAGVIRDSESTSAVSRMCSAVTNLQLWPFIDRLRCLKGGMDSLPIE